MCGIWRGLLPEPHTRRESRACQFGTTAEGLTPWSPVAKTHAWAPIFCEMSHKKLARCHLKLRLSRAEQELDQPEPAGQCRLALVWYGPGPEAIGWCVLMSPMCFISLMQQLMRCKPNWEISM